MTKVAPHLPAPTCSVPLHGRWERAKWLVVAAAFGLFAGLVGGLIMIDKLYPSTTGGPLYIVNRPTNNEAASLDASVVRDWRYRRLWMYDATRVVNGVYPESALIGPAVILNSGGWVVWYSSAAVEPLASTLVGVDWQGITYTLDRVKRMSNGLVFGKVVGANFRATTAFAPWPQWTESSAVWVWGADWHSSKWEKIAREGGVVDEPTVDYGLTAAAPGVIVTTARGELIGLVNKNRRLIPGWMIATRLPDILATGQVVNKTVGWQGEFVIGIATAGVWKETGGFLVTAIRPKSGRTAAGVPSLQKGDVVLLVNQQTVTPDSLAHQLAIAPDEFAASVWRAGKTVEIVAKKELE